MIPDKLDPAITVPAIPGRGLETSPPDMINHPPHYLKHPSGVECITITEHYNFNIGNAIKYLWRSQHKNGLEDLEKARWYVDREIHRLIEQGGG